jgi:hypothetical protein
VNKNYMNNNTFTGDAATRLSLPRHLAARPTLMPGTPERATAKADGLEVVGLKHAATEAVAFGEAKDRELGGHFA